MNTRRGPVALVRHAMRRARAPGVVLAICLGLASILPGCVYPEHYQEWKWKQWNPEYRPLPGDANW
ncbi:MAG TPA: hypothetical protein VJA21_13670 [Verrucomicrobiae bacterium]